MDDTLQARILSWLSWDRCERTREEIRALTDANKVEELRARMLGELVFGTAGIRTRMEAGFARLNELTIIQISAGLAKYLSEEVLADKASGKSRLEGGIVIGYDGRYNSKRFAELAANVFMRRGGLRVHLFVDYVPTPVVSFATRALGCDAGLMITASHNPKDDNGYKVYWSNGAQIIAPHDTNICRAARKEPEPRAEYWSTAGLWENPLITRADACLENYFASESTMCYHKAINEKSTMRITYSAFHGVGSKFARRLFAEYGIPEANLFYVKEQDAPDPAFPTVPFPNPEEGRRVLTLAIATAERSGSTLILANDPDADRLQLAERQSNDGGGEWRIFTGNEMGALLTWWIWKNWRTANPDAEADRVYILNSVVSSQIVATMAAAEGFHNETTLTGFKWMGNRAEELRAAENRVILAWEESIGFMAGSTLDKDGVSAAAIFAEMAIHLRDVDGVSMTEHLFRIYKKYGFHLTRTSYWIVPTPETTKRLFADLRRDASYPRRIGASADGVEVKYVRDLTTGYDSSRADARAILPISASSEMITFTLADGSVVTLRASGTEPKIKYYIELRTAPGKEAKDLSDVEKALDKLEKDVVETLLCPARYGLIERSK